MGLLKSVSTFLLNEKNKNGKDPLDLLMDNLVKSNSEEKLTEVVDCVKIVVGMGHSIQHRHLNQIRRLGSVQETSDLQDKINSLQEFLQRIRI